MRLLQNPNFDFIKLQKPFVIGSIAAAEVISHVGPRPLVELKSLI